MKIGLLIAAIVLTIVGYSQDQVLLWEIYHPVKKNWVSLGEKGSVQEALLNSGELPDPFVGTNEKLYQWIEDSNWIFRSKFEITRQELREDFIQIHFPNVDTYSTITINGQVVGRTENAFHPYTFEIKNGIKIGENEVIVEFVSPVNYHKKMYAGVKTKLPAPNDVNKIAVAPYSRKPQYQFGWDWSMRMNTLGFWKPVVIRKYSSNKILSKNVQTIRLEDNRASMTFELNLQNFSSEKMVWKSSYFEVEIPVGVVSHKEHFSIENAKLWWPIGQGAQHLYSDTWYLIDSKGKTIDSLSIRFGVRMAKLIMEKDEIGTSYVITVNNRPIFCKGGDYIPQDVFPARVEDKDISLLINSMAEANFNMVRVWGGGYYPDDLFYELCDEKGIMVWQDFMFACAMYPGDDAFLANVKNEFDYQIPRISSHPSVVLFNGNNEVDVAWKNWGFQVTHLIVGKEAEKISEDYKRLFQSFLPARIQFYSSVPYIHTSPLSNWGKDEYYDHGSQHYWGVWHGKDPIEDFDKKSGRFNAEYGFQSFPQMSTIATFARSSEYDLKSEVMKNHQKSYVGNGMIQKQTNRLYGEATSFEDFVYKSQLTQAKAVSIAIASHRVQAPRCMGTLYWQVNDCWPAPTWSSVDYYGNWKTLHYQVKKDYADISVVEKIEELGKEKYFLVSSAPGQRDISVRTKVYNLAGELMYSDFSQVEMLPQKAVMIGQNVYSSKFQNSNFYVEFELIENAQIFFKRNFVHLPVKREIASKDDFTFELQYNTDKGTGTLAITSKRFMHAAVISTKENLGVHFLENGLNLLPGTILIEFTSPVEMRLEDLILNWL